MRTKIMVCAAFFFVCLLTGVVPAESTAVINPSVTCGIWEGWGTSLCWWASVFGERDDLADLVFTTNEVALSGDRLPGLGLNIARYNAGACAISNSAMQASPRMASFKKIQGYWVDGVSSDPKTTSWDWSADANQRSMLINAKKRGANLLELFSNSPMWWMCSNRNPSGANSGSDNNLEASNYNSHAIYLAAVAQQARDTWDVNFTSVEAFNEPSADWWSANGTQEGCHFDFTAQGLVTGLLRSNLDAVGLRSSLIAASDESLYDQAAATWGKFSPETRSQIGKVNVHGYQYNAGRRDLLFSALDGKRLWNSEYGDADETGMSLARAINLDFHWLHPTAWCYWQILDIAGWGLIQSRLGEKWIGPVNPKYYVLAHYTRHLRPGMRLLEAGDANTVAAYSLIDKKLVIVSSNYQTVQKILYDLSRFARAEGPVHRWRTQTCGVTKYTRLSDGFLTKKVFQADFPTNSIQTFEILNVETGPSVEGAIVKPHKP